MTDTPIVPPRPYPEENTPSNTTDFSGRGPNYAGQTTDPVPARTDAVSLTNRGLSPTDARWNDPANVQKVDHLTEIEALARNLHNVTPSGAETVRDKILDHVAAQRDPKAYDARIAAEKKAHDEAHAASVKAKADRVQSVADLDRRNRVVDNPVLTPEQIAARDARIAPTTYNKP